MNIFPAQTQALLGNFGNSSISFRSDPLLPSSAKISVQSGLPSGQSLLQVHQLRTALSALKPGRLNRPSPGIAAQAATATSASALDFSSNSATRLSSTQEINTAPTSFRHNGPNWVGQTVTAPWSGLGSTADATVGGNYDGSNGHGILKFKVFKRQGTHGSDDLKIRVHAPDGSTIEDIAINKNDPLDNVYQLSNGLTLQLGEGMLVRKDFFEVDTSLVSSSYTPSDPGWTGSTATPIMGGSYNGNNGTGDLTFQVIREGDHGSDKLQVRVFAPDDSVIQTITVRENDPIDKTYALSNGLTFSLGAGAVIKNETFTVAVDASEPDTFTNSPEWNFGTATASLTGTYDGSHGSGTLTFKAANSGVRGEKDLKVNVYNSDGSMLDTILIDQDDPIDEAYLLSNGLSVTFSEGTLIRKETFTVDVVATSGYSTAPNPVESTAVPVLKGIYDGSWGTDTLTFLVAQEGTQGTDDLSFEVYASDGSLLETVDIGASDPLDQTYTLSSGISLALGGGSLALHETFTLDVSHLVPTSVDPDLAFNGTGAADPKFEDQFAIADGSFKINGNSIEVFANDSINSVLQRINEAEIDITASFDAASETIVMTRNTMGNQYGIVLTNDTSSFLAATKLSTATQVFGGGDETSVLRDLNMFSGVTSGNLSINGVSVSIDVNADSLEDVLEKIDLLVPDVDADFDSNTGHVSLFATSSNDLTISSGGTGFFEALEIGQGLYEHVNATKGKSRQSGYSYSVRRETARAINEFSRRFNGLFQDKYGEQADSFVQQLRSDLQNAVVEIFGPEQSNADNSMGISFNLANPSEGIVDFSDSARKKFDTSIRTLKGATEFEELFFRSTDQHDGLADKLLQIVKRAESSMSLELGSAGSFIDVWA